MESNTASKVEPLSSTVKQLCDTKEKAAKLYWTLAHDVRQGTHKFGPGDGIEILTAIIEMYGGICHALYKQACSLMEEIIDGK